MADKKSSQNLGINKLLIDAAEVQLATFNAGIKFWSQWAEHTSKISESLSKRLQDLRSNPDNAKIVLKKVVEENKQQIKAMTELPGHAVTQFVDEINRFNETKKASKKKEEKKSKPRRSARAKA